MADVKTDPGHRAARVVLERAEAVNVGAGSRRLAGRMGDQLVLHVGTMKSGTSFVQSALAQNQPSLRSVGVRFLGGTFGAQSKAVREVLALPDRPRRATGRWHRLMEELRTSSEPIGVVSMEFLSFAQPPQLAALLSTLHGLRVRIVVTVRDQFRVIPAQWQTYTRNYGTDDWESYLRAIENPPSRRRGRGASNTFHRAQDVPGLLARWAPGVALGAVSAPAAVDVVAATVPPPDAPREELWRRFARAAAIALPDPDLTGVKENPSLGYASCELLRRLNRHLGDVPPRQYRKAMRPLAREQLVPLRHLEDRPVLDTAGAELAASRNAQIREALLAQRVELVGSPSDLPTEARSAHPPRVPPPPPEQVRRAALTAWLRYADGSGGAGSAGTVPQAVDDLVEATARLIRRAHGWQR